MKKIFSFFLNRIPRQWLIRISFWVAPLLAWWYRGKNYIDPIDGRQYRRLMPYGYEGRQRENALAPGSLSLERHRLLWLYLQRDTNFFEEALNMLHVAPEQCFLKRFKQMPNLVYTTADLDSPIADVQMDIHDIPFTQNTFDVILCNHVLEHVQDDKQCMRELYRVLKPGGFAIMQVPFAPGQEKTIEDPEEKDPEVRKKRFGQYDHVRLYGSDYPDRLREAGFTVEIVDFQEKLSPQDYQKYALPKGELLYVGRKE